MSPCPYPGYWGNQSLRESPVPALSVTVQCTRSTQGLSPIPSSFLTLSPGHIPIPATPLCGGCFPHRWGDPKEGSWRWEPHHLEMWNPGGFSKLLQPRGSTSFGCSRCSLTAGGCQDLVVVGRCIGELAYQVHGAGLISWHILPSSLSPKTVHPRDPSLPRLQGYGSVPDH